MHRGILRHQLLRIQGPVAKVGPEPFALAEPLYAQESSGLPSAYCVELKLL
ncbi:hypothetical protein GCM10008938_09980 [Deinococcus roseus]|uniref:Uncharacterized protein n=1 Tax=Deinococcus roseus TaxID=392414 RepID=A0ABQ2CWB4_9DEIO|nr:hypothetical protein GCM10008938_09980 [Deinococcus roseus]